MKGSSSRRPAAATILVAACFLIVAFAGCVADPAPSQSSWTLIEAHEAAWDRAKRLDRSASLAGFIAQDGLPGAPADPWLRERTGSPAAGGEGMRDGRAAHWVLLYATSGGEVLRADVGGPGSVQVERLDGAKDNIAQALWAMNLGGRLLVDSPAAVQAARDADPDLRAHLERHPDAGVAVVSTLAAADDATKDLAYAIYWGPASPDLPFSRYAYVQHFRGHVIEAGAAPDHQESQRVVLVDTSFSLGPYPRQASHEEQLDIPVEDAVMSVDVEGTGEYVLRLSRQGGAEVGRAEGVLVLEDTGHTVELGRLEPGVWVLEAEVLGRLRFDLRIEGVVPVQAWGPP